MYEDVFSEQVSAIGCQFLLRLSHAGCVGVVGRHPSGHVALRE